MGSVQGLFQVPHGSGLEKADKAEGTHYEAGLWTGESAAEVSREFRHVENVAMSQLLRCPLRWH